MPPKKNTSQLSFSEAMAELRELVTWFQSDEVDLEEGLTKLQRGKELAKLCHQRLTKIENDFAEVKADFDSMLEASEDGIEFD